MIQGWTERAAHQALMVVLASCIGVSFAKADSAEATGTVEVAGIENYLAYSGSKLPNGGKVTALVKATFEAMGMKVRIGFLPRKRAYADTKNGKYLASFPWFQDEEREKDFLFSDTLDSTAGGVVVPTSSDLQFFSRQSARRKKACDLLGSHFQSQLFIDEQVTVTRVTDLSQCLKMIKEKRIDFYFADFSSVSKEILGTEAKIIPTDLDLVLKMHLIISRNHPQAQKMMADFNRELMAIKKNGATN